MYSWLVYELHLLGRIKEQYGCILLYPIPGHVPPEDPQYSKLSGPSSFSMPTRLFNMNMFIELFFFNQSTRHSVTLLNLQSLVGLHHILHGGSNCFSGHSQFLEVTHRSYIHLISLKIDRALRTLEPYIHYVQKKDGV